MERAVAIKKLGKMLGKSLGYRVDPKAPSAQEREEARQQLPTLRNTKLAAQQAMHDRREEILAADQQYKDLTDAYNAARESLDKALSIVSHFKFTVGTSNGMFFLVKAQGDSWEDVIEKIEKEKR
jgi:hypothetical protein